MQAAENTSCLIHADPSLLPQPHAHRRLPRQAAAACLAVSRPAPLLGRRWPAPLRLPRPAGPARRPPTLAGTPPRRAPPRPRLALPRP
ncbi:hypothetical protein U9M48_028133 [Paspalum notatum var. saurae]|uniref:Uncharacterized protein n=1 Tax=Paspalum notatum var. saurae TaxID=547442 RepID=A0AAQ3X0R2_PASNO